MSSLMYISIDEKKSILKDLRYKRSKKFNKEYIKILEIIQKNTLLRKYEKKVEDLKDEFIQKLKNINIDDVNWERHEYKGREIERSYNEKLLNLKYEINSFLHQLDVLEKLDIEYKKSFNGLKKYIEKNEKYKSLKTELNELGIVSFQKPTNLVDTVKLIKKIGENIEKLNDIKSRYSILTSYNTSNFQEQIFTKPNQIENILKNIEALSQKEYERIKELDIDEKLILKEAKVIYQRLLYSKLIKEEIENILEDEDIPKNLQEKFQKIKQKELIYKDEYKKLLGEYYDLNSTQNISIDKITKAFEDMGYSFEEVVTNKKGYINTDNKEYKIAYRIEDGKLSLAFTRIIDENIKINEYEKEKDKKLAKKWCSDFEKIGELLKADGIELKKEIIKEPEEVDIRYEMVKKTIMGQTMRGKLQI